MSSQHQQPLINLKIKEYNDIGVETATYISSSTNGPSAVKDQNQNGETARVDKDGTSDTSLLGQHKTRIQYQIHNHRIDIIPSATNKTNAAKDVSAQEATAGRISSTKAVINYYVNVLLQVFLPSGFPNSVTPDYIPYQIFDSLQAFSSSIAGLLASRAVLEGLGVGQQQQDGHGGGSETANGSSSTSSSMGAKPSPTAIMIMSIFQESASRLATILFAWRLGTTLEPEAKRWRLSADIFNDLAMILDCLTPLIASSSSTISTNSSGSGTSSSTWYTRVILLSTASILRALCGVAAASSKATLSQHFAIEARGGNVGELNAKDSSQETVISLLGMWAGSLVLSQTTTPLATWITLMVLLGTHLGMNWLAVRAVCMDTLNRQRACIFFSGLFGGDSLTVSTVAAEKNNHSKTIGRVLTPMEVATEERIFERDGALRWTFFNDHKINDANRNGSKKAKSNGSVILGYCKIGARLEELLNLMARLPLSSNSSSTAAEQTSTALRKEPSASSSYREQISSTSSSSSSSSLTSLLSLFSSEQYILYFSPHSKTGIIVLKSTATVKDQLKAWAHALLVAREMYLDVLNDSTMGSGNRKIPTGMMMDQKYILEKTRDTLNLLTARSEMEIFDNLKGMGWDVETGALETKPGTRVQII